MMRRAVHIIIQHMIELRFVFIVVVYTFRVMNDMQLMAAAKHRYGRVRNSMKKRFFVEAVEQN